MGFEQLAAAVIDKSIGVTWDSAIMEWELEDIWEAEKAGVCVCGHNPIIEHCLVRNFRNGEYLVVGNVCVNRFMGISTTKIFSAFKRVTKDTSKSLNIEALEFLYEHSLITRWELDFYRDIMRKRSLTLKQHKKKDEINKKASRHLKSRLSSKPGRHISWDDWEGYE